MAEIGDEIGAYDTLVLSHPADKRAVWEARSAFLTVIEAETDLIDEMDVVVPVDKIPTFLEYAHEIGDKYEVRIRSFGHAGDGNAGSLDGQDLVDAGILELTVKFCADGVQQAHIQLVVQKAVHL